MWFRVVKKEEVKKTYDWKKGVKKVEKKEVEEPKETKGTTKEKKEIKIQDKENLKEAENSLKVLKGNFSL